MNSKTDFWKIFFLQFRMFPKVLYSKSAGTKISIFKIWQDENFSYQSLRLKEKNSFRIWFFFFQKTSFQTLILLKRFASKSCLLKSARKVKTMLFFPEQIESKRFFFRCDFFIEIWFLNKNWTQKLSFWKIFFLQNMIIRKVFYYKICRSENFSIQNLKFWKVFISKFYCAGKRMLQNLILSFSKISFQTLIFNEKVCYKVKAV